MTGQEGAPTDGNSRDRALSTEGVGLEEDNGSFESLFRRHYPRVVQTLCVATLDREVAADAAQEAFLRLYVDWEQVSRYENRVGWVYRVALNRSRDYRRRSLRLLTFRQSQPTRPAQSAEIEWDPERSFIEALKELPDRQRQAVALHYVAGFSQKETAEAMGLSEGAVKSHLFRARETLHKKLEVE